MQRPQDRGTPIDANRYHRWSTQFAGYRNPVNGGLIEIWLKQFKSRDVDLAARTLDAILFINAGHIADCFRQRLNNFPGWSISKERRQGKWAFVPFSGSAGESGDSMLHSFRMATYMTHRRYNNLFLHRSELVSAKLGPEDTVVLIDDFAGTGSQACDSWKLFEELLTGGPKVILLVVAATQIALSRIAAETEMEAVCCTVLRHKDNIFDSRCNHFSAEEKNQLLAYCQTADLKCPKGWGDTGLLVVFAHRCPNNTIPILHTMKRDWSGLFPRQD